MGALQQCRTEPKIREFCKLGSEPTRELGNLGPAATPHADGRASKCSPARHDTDDARPIQSGTPLIGGLPAARASGQNPVGMGMWGCLETVERIRPVVAHDRIV